ncbi:MAG: PilZ domain-containing protein [Candidatus Hydrogenedentes bacterium]|nr:PilZ domain-containing protein [Candidatus Hydrogenedentota bacterium]
MALERRKLARRHADREILNELTKLRKESGSDSQKELRQLRRRAIRHHCEARIALRLNYQMGRADEWQVANHPIQARILDLSPEGCQIFAAQPLDIGSELSLQLNVAQQPPMQAIGIVRWMKGVPNKRGFACGVEFMAVKDDAQKRIQHFLKDLDDNIGL